MVQSTEKSYFATWYRTISSVVLKFPVLHKINLSRKFISAFSRLRFHHTLILLQIILG